tara:strand:- start:6177 stop:8384 length:2208 start_codon:yes stop_codon:yes gene_type:complete
VLDRAKIIDEKFYQRVSEQQFPTALSGTTPTDADLSHDDLLALFDAQAKSRHCDLVARQLKEQELGFYTIGSSGHEGNAAIAKAFRADDMALLHYRSGAFVFQRAAAEPSIDMVHDQLLALTASSDDPIAGGRHKVFGSTQLSILPQTSTVASHLPKAVGLAISITRGKELGLQTALAPDSVVLCSFGDASLNHSTAQGAMNTVEWVSAARYPLPLVMICEDNGIGISMPTPHGWVAANVRHRQGIHYLCADGLNICDVYQKAREAEELARRKHQPVFLHMRCVRLLGHAGSDIESVYHSEEDIVAAEANDPLLHTARILVEQGIASTDEIILRYQNIKNEFEKKSAAAVARPKLTSAAAVAASIVPSKSERVLDLSPNGQQREAIFNNHQKQLTLPRNLSQQLNLALTDLMITNPEILVFGEDVGKKGGVYHVTADLQKRFGQRRVFDTIVDEQTILGTAIGMSLNGFLPIPEIQFLAYLHNAEDQLRGEAATQAFFSNGQFSNPMVIRIASLAYQKGFGGHFHNDNSIAVLRDLPGVIVACPSNGEDGAKMLRECVRLAYEENRIVIFLEPIALYMTKDLHIPGDSLWLSSYSASDMCIPFGELGIHGDSDELAIITYGNGYYLSRQAAKIIEKTHQRRVKVIDLRWLAPLNKAAIIDAIQTCQHVLIVDEGRQTGSLSEELVTLIVETMASPPAIKRLCGRDCFIPLGQAWQHVLPSRDDIVTAVKQQLNIS